MQQGQTEAASTWDIKTNTDLHAAIEVDKTKHVGKE